MFLVSHLPFETPTLCSTRTSVLWRSLSESQTGKNEGSSLTELEFGAIHGILPHSSIHGEWNFQRKALQVSIIFDLARLLKRQIVWALQYMENDCI